MVLGCHVDDDDDDDDTRLDIPTPHPNAPRKKTRREAGILTETINTFPSMPGSPDLADIYRPELQVDYYPCGP